MVAQSWRTLIHVDRAQYIAELKATGHFRSAAIRQANGWYRVECECGYRSTSRINLEQCVETIEHHRRKVLAEVHRNGRVVTSRKVKSS